MGTATTDDTFWSFVNYIKKNPFKSVGGMTNDDIDNMVKLFQAANATEITSAADPNTTYTDIQWPGQTASATPALLASAKFPESLVQ